MSSTTIIFDLRFLTLFYVFFSLCVFCILCVLVLFLLFYIALSLSSSTISVQIHRPLPPSKGKGKFHPGTGREGPEKGVEV